MPRIAGVDVPPEKQIAVSLTYVYGIGQKVARNLLKSVKIDPVTKAKDLRPLEIQELNKKIATIPVEGELRKMVRDNIERLKRIGTYRGLRHSMRLPSHGQRTRTNARTLKGAKKTVGAMTKEARSKVEPSTTTPTK